jgi:hypothetical protein
MTAEDACRIALALPEVVEIDHHGRRAFRVARSHLATLWDDTHMNVMLDEPGVRTAVEAHPDWCAECWWGKRLTAVRVDLERAPATGLAELLADAWEGKAGMPLAPAASPPRNRAGGS